MAKRNAGFTSITARWLRGSLLITAILVVVAETLFLYSIYQDLYGGVRQAVLSRFSTIEGQLSATGTAGDESNASASRGQALRRTVELFDEKDKFEFMFIGTNGKILATSTGFMPSDEMHLEDVHLAQNASDGISTNIYRTSLGEKVLTATCIIKPEIDSIYAIRLVTSLEKVDGEINIVVALAFLVAVAIVSFSIMSGMYFSSGFTKYALSFAHIMTCTSGILRQIFTVSFAVCNDKGRSVSSISLPEIYPPLSEI